MKQEDITIIVAVNNVKVLQQNLLLSPDMKTSNIHLIIKKDCRSAALAYNEGIEEAKSDILIFVHQDIYFPERWFSRLTEILSYFEIEKIHWGVLGCFGVREEKGERIAFGRIFSNGWGWTSGREIKKPEPVQTLDEIVLILRKSSGLQFDPTLPHFHLYGTDICLAARERGMPSYVIPVFCIHNTNQLLSLPKEFYECYRHVKGRWMKYLPIRTPCIRISRFDRDVVLERIRKWYRRLQRKKMMPIFRVKDPRTLIKPE